MAWLLIVVGLLTWAGAALLIDAWPRRRPRRDRDLAERLLPFHPSAIGDEAQRWLEDNA